MAERGINEWRDRVPKIVGCDTELGNAIHGVGNVRGTGALAARMLLREIEGIPSGYSHSAQDSGRKFLLNGSCAYIDLDHLECPLQELTSARDYVAAWHGMLRVVRDAQLRATAKLNPALRLEVFANNSDGLGHSYGGHLSFLMSRRAFDDLFLRKLHYLLYLAAFKVSSIVLAGQGKVGSENGAPDVDYQISQRADFYEALTGLQTTFRRPLVNSRDEALCGRDQSLHGVAGTQLARLHDIFYDTNLCHEACFLKVGMMQCILAMIEAQFVNTQLLVDDPVGTVVRWSHDPTLRAKARLASGESTSAVDLQFRFCDEASRFDARGGFEGIVPYAGEILARWRDTLVKLRERRFDELAGSLDWVLKLQVLQRAMATRPELSWKSPQIKHLDHLYSSLDPDAGLYFAYERAGVVRRVASEKEIERFRAGPPEDTRAWTRAMLLARARPEDVRYVDWDQIEFVLPDKRGWRRWRKVWLAHPARRTKAETQHLFGSSRSLAEIVDELSDDDELLPARLPMPTLDDPLSLAGDTQPVRANLDS
jgi:proteasome accessory factor A